MDDDSALFDDYGTSVARHQEEGGGEADGDAEMGEEEDEPAQLPSTVEPTSTFQPHSLIQSPSTVQPHSSVQSPSTVQPPFPVQSPSTVQS